MEYFKIKGLFSFCSFSQSPKITASIYFLSLLLLSIAVWGSPFQSSFLSAWPLCLLFHHFHLIPAQFSMCLWVKQWNSCVVKPTRLNLVCGLNLKGYLMYFWKNGWDFQRQLPLREGGVGKRWNSEWQQFSHRLLPWIKRSFLNWDNFSVQVLKVTIWIPTYENVV